MNPALTLFSLLLDSLVGMFSGRSLLALWAIFTVAPLAGSVGEASAQCTLCGITPGESRPDSDQQQELSIEFETTLDFDKLLLNGSGPGWARLSPEGDRDVSGSVESIGGRAAVGRLVVHGAPNRPVSIDFPRTIELVGMSGTVITIRELYTDLPSDPVLDSSGRLVVSFGGQVTVDGDSGGDYRGNLLIRADYL